jgi:hypothetical protein
LKGRRKKMQGAMFIQYANPEDDPFRKAMKAAAKKLNHSPNSPSEPQPEPVTAQV